MVNISVKEILQQFETKEVNLAQVNTEDGRTFSVSISMKISENQLNQKSKNENIQKQCNDHSSIECDTSGCMNSSPDSDRSGILNAPEFDNNATCNVDDFLNNFGASTVFPPTINEDLVDEDDCESNADSDCNSVDVEYYVVDQIVGKRFNEKIGQLEFLLRPKKQHAQKEIMWNPIDNQDNFDISLLDHNRLFIEMPATKLKKEEKRKRSVLQDKFLSEVNISSEKKSDYQSSASVDHRNSNVCRKLDTSAMVMDNSLNKFDNMSDIYMCQESNDTPIDIDIASNFEELVPVLIDSVPNPQPTDCAAFQTSLLATKKVKPERPNSRRKEYFCADCDFQVSTKADLTKHVRLHMTINKVRRNNRRKIQDSSPISRHSRSIKSRAKENTKFETKHPNGVTDSKKERFVKPTKSRKSNDCENGLVLKRVENDSIIEGERVEKDLMSDHRISDDCGSETTVPANPVNNEEDSRTPRDNHLNQSSRKKSDVKFKKGDLYQNAERIKNAPYQNVKKNRKNVVRLKERDELPKTDASFLGEEEINALPERSISPKKKQKQKKMESSLNGLFIDKSFKRSNAEIEGDENQNTHDDRASKKCKNSFDKISLETEPLDRNIREVPLSKNDREQSRGDATRSLLPAIKDTLNELIKKNKGRGKQASTSVKSKFDEFESGAVTHYEEIALCCDSSVSKIVSSESSCISIPVAIPLCVLEYTEIEELKTKLRAKKETGNQIVYEIVTLGSDEVDDCFIRVADLPETSQSESTLCSLPELSTLVLPSSSLSIEAPEHESSQFSENNETDDVVFEVVNEMIKFLETSEKLSPESSEIASDSLIEDLRITLDSQKLPSCSSKDLRLARRKRDTSSGRKRDTSSVRKRGTSSARERDTSSVRKRDTSSVRKRDTSSARKRDTSSVRKRDTSSVRKRDTSSVRYQVESQITENSTEVRSTPKEADLSMTSNLATSLTPDKKTPKDHHTLNKFTRCPFCSKSFASSSSRRRHEREKHADYLPYVSLTRLDVSKLTLDVSKLALTASSNQTS